jgi:hypothetical protein
MTFQVISLDDLLQDLSRQSMLRECGGIGWLDVQLAEDDNTLLGNPRHRDHPPVWPLDHDGCKARRSIRLVLP